MTYLGREGWADEGEAEKVVKLQLVWAAAAVRNIFSGKLVILYSKHAMNSLIVIPTTYSDPVQNIDYKLENFFSEKQQTLRALQRAPVYF